MAAQYVGQWDQSHGASYNSSLSSIQKISQLPGLLSYDAFSVNYTDTGLFGARYVTDGKSMEEALNITGAIQRLWKHLSTGITDEELDRTKHQLRTNLLAQLSDNAAIAQWLATEASHFPFCFFSNDYLLFLDYCQGRTVEFG